MISAARAYLAKVPPAAAGSRNDSLNKLAFQMLERFKLSFPDFESLLLEWSATCSPPIPDGEALKTIHSAWHGASQKGVIGSKARQRSSHATRAHAASATPKSAKAHYDLSDGRELPEAVDDGARLLLRTVFQPGEGVRIVNAVMDEEKGGEVPDGAGPCLSREEWLSKLDKAKGDPNGIFSSSKKTGIYIAINPLNIGGSKDSDVTAFRHALVEFDEGLSPEEQFLLYQKSKLPCSAIIYSGGKSVHAWVRIDAETRQEYDDRVRQLYQHFESAGYHLDQKNKNPGRLSRLPNCVRFERRQELLALNSGCESFTEWLKQIDGESLGKCERFSDLMELDTSNDPNCVIGFKDGKTTRFLCRGKSAWIIGPSGMGKSSLICEFAIGWALGKSVYGITPKTNLRSLIIQAENDKYDLAEMVQGISRAHSLDCFQSEQNFDLVDRNVLFKTESTSIGDKFVDRMHRLIDRERPDIVWLDPLLSFAGIEVSRQDQVTHFLRELINPVLESTGVVLIGVHHTGKPKSGKETANWTAIDWAYQGIGSSELVNWARAVMSLRQVSDSQFELKMAKRGRRAWATDLEGQFTTSVWLQHASKDIRWEQIAAPQEDSQKPDREKKKTKSERMASSNLYEVLSKIPDSGESALAIGKRLHAFSRKKHDTVSLTTCRTDLLDLLCENQKLEFNADSELYFKGKNI